MEKFYSDCEILIVGCNLFLDTQLTNFVPNGSYSNGVLCYTISDGSISFISNCPQAPTSTPTPTPIPPTTTPTPTPQPTSTPTPTPQPVVINWELFESNNQYFVDSNMQIYINDIPQLPTPDTFVNGLGTLNAFVGDSIRINYFHFSGNGTDFIGGIFPNNSTNPRLQLLIDNNVVPGHDNLINITDATNLIAITQLVERNYVFNITNNIDILVRGILSPPIPTPTPTMIPTPTPTPISQAVVIDWRHDSLSSTTNPDSFPSSGIRSSLTITYIPHNSISNIPVQFVNNISISDPNAYTTEGTLLAKAGTNVIGLIQNFGFNPLITQMFVSNNSIGLIYNNSGINSVNYTINSVNEFIIYKFDVFTQNSSISDPTDPDSPIIQ